MSEENYDPEKSLSVKMFQCTAWQKSITPGNLASNAINTLRPRQNGRHFPDDILKWIFLNENVWISINISLKFVPRGPINNITTLVQVMAWRRQAIIWTNDGSFIDAYMPHSASMS